MSKIKTHWDQHNITNEMSKSNIKFIPIQNKNVIVHVCFVLFLVCLYVCVCECLLPNNMRMYTSKYIHRSEVHCGSAVRFGQALPGYLITAHHLYASLG